MPLQTRLTKFFERPTKSDGKWSEENSILIFGPHNPYIHPQEQPVKVASFDLDYTLIATKSKRRFSSDSGDWRFLYPEVPTRLKKLYESGYIIVVFTNQGGLNLDPSNCRKREFKLKVEDVLSKIKAPITVIASLKDDFFRKPCPGMWRFFVEQLGGRMVDYSESFFVGDAAGREAGWKAGYGADHSRVDRYFAMNVGLGFFTPEEFFLQEAAIPFADNDYLPRVRQWQKGDHSDAFVTFKSRLDTPGVVLLLGPPLCGKSDFARKYFASLDHVLLSEGDVSGKHVRSLLSAEKLVVIESSSATVAARRRLLSTVAGLAKVSCLWFELEYDLAKHLHVFWAVAKGIARPASLVVEKYFSSLQAPTINEGFSEVLIVTHPIEFASATEEEVFGMRLN